MILIFYFLYFVSNFFAFGKIKFDSPNKSLKVAHLMLADVSVVLVSKYKLICSSTKDTKLGSTKPFLFAK